MSEAGCRVRIGFDWEFEGAIEVEQIISTIEAKRNSDEQISNLNPSATGG